VLEAFRKGYYQVLFTRDILNEGVDFPECSAVMFLRPTISKTIFLQQLGRGLRKHPGKEDVLVLDFIGNYIRAFEKKKWFLQAATHEYTGKYIKPVYEYNHPKPIVEFDSRVVQMMEIQKHGFRTWEPASKEKIYQDYMNCCEKEVKILNTEGYRKSQYAKYSINTLLNYFDTFMNFVKECNITYERKHLCPPLFHYCNDRKKLIDNFLKVKKKFNKEGLKNRKDPISNNPTNDYINDPKNSRYGTQSYERVWGYYGNFLIEMGHVKDGVFKINNSRDIEYRNNEVKKAVEKLQEKLGRKHFSKTEWRKEYGALGRFIIDHGGFGSFKRKYNIPDKFEGKCMICGNKFNSRYTTTVVCSVKCANTKWYIENTGKQRIEERKDKLKTIQKCINCGKKYYPWKQHDRIRYSKYCSRQCMSDFGYKKRVGRKEQQ
jgi:superfamily II DNA/RNA helicase